MEKRYQKEINSLGLRIKQLREAKGLSQLDLELRAGIIRTGISKIENGKKNVEFMTLVKLAEALEVELFELFTTPKT
jgi:HTH-type transcriptional regulator, competence development regulator